MICPKCGKTYGTKLTYCISCGCQLESEKAPNEIKDSEPAAKPIMVSPTFFSGDEPLTVPSASAVRSISMTSREAKPKRKKSGGRLAKGAASTVLSATLFAAMILFFGSCIGRAATDENNAAKAVRNMDILNIPAKELQITEYEGETFPEDSTVGEAIAIMTEGSGVDESNIRRIYDRSTVKEFIGSTAAEYAAYIRSGKKPEEVTPERVKSLLGENISVINTNTGVTLSQNDIELAYDQIELSKDALACLSASNLEQGRSGEILKAVRAFLSVPIVLAELLFSAAIIAAIAIINKNPHRSMIYCGTPIFLAGSTAAVFTFMFSMQLGLFGNLSGLKKETAAGISAAVSENAYQLSAMMMFLGLCILIIARSARHGEKKQKSA
ncbi:MAG: hypothetical protein ACI4I1_02345 [Oscillospiraceae bacterium]